jgi:hypothetical protein
MHIGGWLLVVLLCYVGFVALREALIGFVQPDMEGGVRLATKEPDGTTSERMLASARLDGNLYIASNHWLRGWYRSALAAPEVRAEVDGEEAAYLAVPIVGEERVRVSASYRMGFVLRFVCGFAPSKFLRLDRVGGASP